MAPACTLPAGRVSICRDAEAATYLKLASLLVIFLASAFGISSPVFLARYFQGSPAYKKAVLLIKCFAAGVILSTSLVHVLPDAVDALSDCSVTSKFRWTDFPFAGLLTLCGCVAALFVDITASAHLMGEPHDSGNQYAPVSRVEIEEGESCSKDDEKGELMADLKQKVVSQVLEIGIIFHSVIIGVTMGMSQNRCTIRPLIVALSFHQMFEGFGLGGCIVQAGFPAGTVAFMSLMFAATTPMGILLGMIIFAITGFDNNEPKALIMEGFLGAFSCGILLYMGLVDLIAIDFFQNKMMSSVPWLKKASFAALLVGSLCMSLLALWA